MIVPGYCFKYNSVLSACLIYVIIFSELLEQIYIIFSVFFFLFKDFGLCRITLEIFVKLFSSILICLTIYRLKFGLLLKKKKKEKEEEEGEDGKQKKMMKK